MTRLLIVFAAVFALCSLTKGSMFLSTSNFQSMGKQFPEFGLLSIGMALALFTGGIDLSIVYIATLSSVIIARLLPLMVTETATDGTAYMMVIVCFILAIAVGIICGMLNGFIISKVGIPPILATLGTQALFQGFAIVITGGSTISGFPIQLSTMVNKLVFGIPVTVIVFIICAIVVGFILARTTLGRQLRMLGTNPKATEYTGLNNVKLTMTSYMMSGILASIAGIIMIGRFNSAKADYGASYTMQAILIAVMGGIDPNGGKGNIQGVAIAIIIIQMVSSWLNMFENVSNFYRQIIWGGLLIFILIFNYVINVREKKAAMKK
ncbi:MAG: ABC-type transporter, integral rane subunit [Clostridia bacterium]|nr:ABC-type transporter, integral rane subunit [Clostridia bacterium]